MPGDDTTSRRKFLTAAGGAAAGMLLAGCSSGGSNGGSGNNSSGAESGSTNGSGASGESATNGGSASNANGTSASNSQSGSSGEFPVTITQGQMPTSLDPHDNRDTPTDTVVLQAYEGLLRRTSSGKIKSSLASDWKRQSKGTVRFTIRKGPTFHKTGNKLTPEDVAYSINRIVKDDVGFTSPQSGQLEGVTGAKAVEGKNAVDVTSDGLNPIVFSEFAIYGDMMEKKWTKKHDQSYIAKHMNGTGPFELTSYEENDRVVFERFEDYWQDPAAVSKLTFNAATKSGVRVNQLVTGETDLIVNVPPESASRVKSNKGTDLAAVGSTRVLYNAMRYDVEPFSSPKFRQAMNYAVNLDSIVNNILQGFGSKVGQPTLEPFFGYNGNVKAYPHDKKKAQQLVEQSGHAGAKITLHTPVGRYLKDVEIAQAVSNMIDQLPNVSCSLKQRDFGSLADQLTDGKIETGPHFYLIGWGNATFDASQTIDPLLTSGGALTSFENEKLDSLMEEAGTTGKKSQRKKILQQANKLCHDQAPWIFLNRQYSVYGTANRIQWKPRNDERIDAYAIQPSK